MTKPNRKPDRRVRRTRRQLQTALRELIQDKPYNKITKVDVVQQADISRATFYLHYETVDELLIQLLASIGDEVAEYLEKSNQDYVSLQKLTRLLFDGIVSDRVLYRELKGTIVLSAVMNQLVQEMIPIIKNTLSHTTETNIDDLVAYQIAGALSASVLWWIDHNFSPSASKMTTLTLDQLSQILPNNN